MLLEECELPELVYNSNTIENSALTFRETEKILLELETSRGVSVREIALVMNPGGVFMTQATSTYFTPRAYWVDNNNVQAVFGFRTTPSINVPSFGEWGYVMSVAPNEAPKRQLPDQLVYLNDTVLHATHLLPSEVEAK